MGIPPKEPPSITGLKNIAAHMGWSVNRLLRMSHPDRGEHFPLQQTFVVGRLSSTPFRYILYLADLERWQEAKRKATQAHVRGLAVFRQDHKRRKVPLIRDDQRLDKRSYQSIKNLGAYARRTGRQLRLPFLVPRRK